MLKIITQQLSTNLQEDHFLQKNKTVDPTNFNKLHNLLKSVTIREICVFDATASMQIPKHETIQIRDHINNTGTNILIGQQKLLEIDFPNLSEIYTYNQNSIITECCGKILNKEKLFPSHYICHITTMARAMKFRRIIGFLYNTTEQDPANY